MTPESASKLVQQLLTEAVARRGASAKFVSAFGHTIDKSFWIGVPTDRERDRLKSDAGLAAEFARIFTESGYTRLIEEDFEKTWSAPRFDAIRPTMEYLKRPAVVIESQETVDRDFQGSWFHCMK